MNLVTFSIKTKGLRNFARRFRTVFTRFGFSENRTRRALGIIMDSLQKYNAVPTFFIPAIVLRRHAALIAEIAQQGTEIGIHGYVHNDYRYLDELEQFSQTKQAISVFERTHISYHGVRNPYLGWTNASLRVFTTLGFAYESNEAIIHDVIDLDDLSPLQRGGYKKSLALFQAIPCHVYNLRPHFEGTLLRIPTSIPDDEMLFDRLRFTDPKEVGGIWNRIMQRIYDLGGLYTLNLHPERAVLCKPALETLLSCASTQQLPVWITSLKDVAMWWKERSQFRLSITPQAPGRWRVEAICTPRATLLARYLEVEDQSTSPWMGAAVLVRSHSFSINTEKCPCIGVSLRTPEEVVSFLYEQGYPVQRSSQEESENYAFYVDSPEGLGVECEAQVQKKCALVQQVETLAMPFLHFGCWPDGSRAALAISGDIDSVTIQDFFLRVFEVRQKSH